MVRYIGDDKYEFGISNKIVTLTLGELEEIINLVKESNEHNISNFASNNVYEEVFETYTEGRNLIYGQEYFAEYSNI